MTRDERDPRSGQNQGSDQEVFDFGPDDTEAPPVLGSSLWDEEYPEPRSSGIRWGWTPDNNQAVWCGTPSIRLISLLDGTPWSAPYKCRSWGHRPCAEETAAAIIRLLERRFRTLGGVWYAVFDGTRKARDRLRQRRSGRSDGWVSFRRTDGRVAYFSTAERSGRLSPSEWAFLPPDVALFVAAQFALAQPGVERVDWSPGWKPRSTAKGARTNVGYGIRDDALWTAAVDDACDILVDIHGVTWDPWRERPPDPITIEEWTEVVGEQVRRLLETSRLDHGQQQPHG
jgi:hypothetical protein